MSAAFASTVPRTMCSDALWPSREGRQSWSKGPRTDIISGPTGRQLVRSLAIACAACVPVMVMMRTLPIAGVVLTLLGSSALAQVGSQPLSINPQHAPTSPPVSAKPAQPTAKPPQRAAKVPSTPEARSAAALALSADPVFDEGTFARIKEALLGYSGIQVRGGWPSLPSRRQARPRCERAGCRFAAPTPRHHRRSGARAGSRRSLRRRRCRSRQTLPVAARARGDRQPSARRRCARSTFRSARASSSSKRRSSACSAWISSSPSATSW